MKFMMNLENIREFTRKYQTNDKNIIREYTQHLFLSNLYKINGSEKLLFKGGTALRIIHSSPRFSEDLDFTALIHEKTEIDKLFISTLSELESLYQLGVESFFSKLSKHMRDASSLLRFFPSIWRNARRPELDSFPDKHFLYQSPSARSGRSIPPHFSV